MVTSNLLTCPDFSSKITTEKIDSFLTVLFLDYAKRFGEIAGGPKANLETRYIIHCIYEKNISNSEELTEAWSTIQRTTATEKFKELAAKWMWNDVSQWMRKFASILYEPLVFE